MLLVLTYHRVVESPWEINGFFDVCVSELEAHIRAAAAVWGGAGSPGALQDIRTGGSKERRGFLVTFDDGTADHYSIAAPVLERNGLKGVFFVNTSLVGTSGYLSLGQCQELQARGHANESHSHEHKVLTGLTEYELRSQLCSCHQRLRESGLGQWNFLAVPGGVCNGAVVQAAKESGYQCLRTLEWGYNRIVNPFRVESFAVNRRVAGRWLAWLISPRLESSKKAAYQAKEMMKKRAPELYQRARG